MTGKVRASHGLRQLLSQDPCSFLLYAIEQAQAQAHHRRLGRVLRRLRRRKHELGWVHVSDASNPCDRVIAALLLGYQLPQEERSPQKQRIFENGTYMHLRFYNYFLSLPPPFDVEIAVALRRWPLVGEADVIVTHPEFGRHIIELKSMNHEQFKILGNPQSSHAAQLNGYLGLAGLEAGQLWYENKNTQEVKTFFYAAQPEVFIETQERLLAIVKTMLTGLLPQGCGVCGLDNHIGGLTGVEERLIRFQEVRAAWQS